MFLVGVAPPTPSIRSPYPCATCLAAVLLSVLAGCGGGDAPTTPGALATPAPADSGRSNMTLLAHLDTAALAGRSGVRGSGNWGYTSPDGRRC
jgi:hypothetical protein